MKLGFLHIPRTGGTYLEALLQTLGPKEFINFFGTPSNQKTNQIGLIEQISSNKEKQKSLQTNKNWTTCKVFSGHFSHEIKQFIPDSEDVSFFTILRDPIARTASFIKKVTTSRRFAKLLMDGSEAVGDEAFWKNFKKYIDTKSSAGLLTHEIHGFSNYMTKAIAGCNLWDANLTVNECVFDTAKRNLDNMKYVGLFENYEHSINHILNMFSINTKPSIKLSKNPNIPSFMNELLSELNSFDIKLYSYFCSK